MPSAKNNSQEIIEIVASRAKIPQDVFNRVVYQRARACIRRRGGAKVFLINEEEMKLLEKAQDILEVYLADRAWKEFEDSGQELVSHEEVREEFGI